MPRKPASRELTRSGSGGAIFSRFREFFRRFTRLVSPSIARGVKVVCQIHLMGFTHAISPDSRSVATKRGSQPTRFARLAPIAVTMRGSQPTRLARLALSACSDARVSTRRLARLAQMLWEKLWNDPKMTTRDQGTQSRPTRAASDRSWVRAQPSRSARSDRASDSRVRTHQSRPTRSQCLPGDARI